MTTIRFEKGVCFAYSQTMSDWHLYIVRCAENTLYTGIATDVERRFLEHQSGGPKAAKYLRGRGPLTLVYRRRIGSRSMASIAEHRFKRLTKAKKESLLKDETAMQHALGLVV